jgi:hypothetical protein
MKNQAITQVEQMVDSFMVGSEQQGMRTVEAKAAIPKQDVSVNLGLIQE